MENKYLIVMDTHIKESNISLIENLFDQIIDVCKKYDIKHILHGGDMFNARKAQSLSVLRCFDYILDQIHEGGLHMHVIPGNHDRTNLEKSESYLDVFRHHEALSVYDPEYSIDHISAHMVFHMLPYFKEDGSYWQRLSDLKIVEGKRNILITHIAVNGVKNNGGTSVKNNITADLFNRFDSVYVGHYHNKSSINDRIHYLGSLYPANYGEDNDKGVHILSEDGSLEFLKLDFPEYYTIGYDASNVKDMQKAMKDLSKNHENNHVRIKVTGTEDQLKNMNKKDFEQFTMFDMRYETKTSNRTELKEYKESDLLEAFTTFTGTSSDIDQSIIDLSHNYIKKALKS